ncbi:hypothetical protein GGF31_004444 [Allomyces arbusculus]|nr:hypothetical protein GGF31_004444 [Allomyces arbusculus]
MHLREMCKLTLMEGTLWHPMAKVVSISYLGLDGESLNQYIINNKLLNEDQALLVLVQVLKRLEFLHQILYQDPAPLETKIAWKPQEYACSDIFSAVTGVDAVSTLQVDGKMEYATPKQLLETQYQLHPPPTSKAEDLPF